MTNRWSHKVTTKSNALDLDPKRIARSLRQSADASTRRKSSAHASAMSMLNFYINRAGKNLSQERLRVLNQARQELKNLK